MSWKRGWEKLQVLQGSPYSPMLGHKESMQDYRSSANIIFPEEKDTAMSV
jgi:hypothetical protein